MSSKPRFRRTTRYIRTHWPIYLGLYVTLVAGVLLIGLSLAFGWYAYITFSLAVMLIAAYLLVAFVYVAYRLNDAPGGTAVESLIDLAQLKPHQRVVCIDLGLKASQARKFITASTAAAAAAAAIPIPFSSCLLYTSPSPRD